MLHARGAPEPGRLGVVRGLRSRCGNEETGLKRLLEWLRPSLRVGVGVVGYVLFLGGLGVLVFFLAVRHHRVIEESAKAHYTDYARLLAITLAEPAQRGDRKQVRELVSAGVAGSDGIHYVAVADAAGQVYASAGRRLWAPGRIVEERVLTVEAEDLGAFHEAGHLFDIGVPLVRDGAHIGSVSLGVSTRQMNEGLWPVLKAVAPPTMLGILLFSALGFVVDRRLRRLLTRFVQAARRMAEGNLESPVEIHTGDYLEELARSFNRMADAVRERDAALRLAKETLEETVRDRTRELSAGKERLDVIVGAVGAGMLLLDPELNVLWANRVAEDWLGSSHLVGMRCPGISENGGQRCSACPSHAAIATGRTELGDAISVHVDGVTRYFAVVSSPIVNTEGHVSEVLELILDVTRQKEVEADLVQAAKLATLGELAGGVAHEIGNPVAIISAKSKLLLDELRAGRAPERLARDLAAIERHSERIGRISSNLLNFARRAPDERTSVSLAHVAREASALVEHRLAAGKVSVEVHIDDALPPVRASRNELVQVFVNLLQNAIDAMPRGGEIRIDAGEHDEMLHVLVSDTGTGMTSAIVQRLFQPFFTTKEPGKGTGLGLSISQSILRDHGGTLTVESRPGEGSTFVMRLPVSRTGAHA